MVKPVPVEPLRVQDSLSAEYSLRLSMVVFPAWLCWEGWRRFRWSSRHGVRCAEHSNHGGRRWCDGGKRMWRGIGLPRTVLGGLSHDCPRFFRPNLGRIGRGSSCGRDIGCPKAAEADEYAMVCVELVPVSRPWASRRILSHREACSIVSTAMLGLVMVRRP